MTELRGRAARRLRKLERPVHSVRVYPNADLGDCFVYHDVEASILMPEGVLVIESQHYYVDTIEYAAGTWQRIDCFFDGRPTYSFEARRKGNPVSDLASPYRHP